MSEEELDQACKASAEKFIEITEARNLLADPLHKGDLQVQYGATSIAADNVAPAFGWHEYNVEGCSPGVAFLINTMRGMFPKAALPKIAPLFSSHVSFERPAPRC